MEAELSPSRALLSGLLARLAEAEEPDVRAMLHKRVAEVAASLGEAYGDILPRDWRAPDGTRWRLACVGPQAACFRRPETVGPRIERTVGRRLFETTWRPTQ